MISNDYPKFYMILRKKINTRKGISKKEKSKNLHLES